MRKRYHKKHGEIGRSRDLIISISIIMVTTLGTTIPLYIHSSMQTASQIEAIRGDVVSIQNEIRMYHTEIQSEMKDFHGRLCSIEERKQKKIGWKK